MRIEKAIEQIPVEIKFSTTSVCKYSDFVILVHRNRKMREKIGKRIWGNLKQTVLTCVHLDKFFEPFLSRRHATDDSENINSPKNSLSH